MSDTGAKWDTQRLLSLLGEQRGMFRQLRRLAERQQLLVLQDEPQPLLELLTERQQLVDGLGGLNAQLGEYKKNWTTVYAGLDEGSRKQVAELLEEVNASLGMILQSDSRDTATLTARRHNMADQLTVFDARGRVGAAYAGAARTAGPSMTDAKV